MTDQHDPDDEWSSYDPTQYAQRPDLTKHDAPPLPPTAGYPTPGYPQPPYPPNPYPAPYPYPAPNRPVSPPPSTGQVSSIVAVCIGAILTLSCYGTLIGIAPLVLGILGLNKSNAVSRMWSAGREVEAVDAAASSKNLAMWAWISLAIGLVIALILIVVFVVWVINADPSAPTHSPYGTYDA